MDSQITVKKMLAELLAISHSLAPFDMPLLDAHGATLADDIYVDDQVVLHKGTRIRSPQIGLAASLGLSRLPTQPHPPREIHCDCITAHRCAATRPPL